MRALAGLILKPKGRYLVQKRLFISAGFVLLVLFAAACASGYHRFAELRYAATTGDPASDTAFVYLQGGPTGEVEDFVIAPEALPALVGNDAFFVVPFQIQTRETDRFASNPISFEQAIAEANTTTQIAGEVIQHLKDEGKTVHVLGFSYGAFVAADVLAEFGNIADTFVIAFGRIDMTDQVWRSFADGKPMTFANGTVPIPAGVEDAGMGMGSEVGDQNMMRLAAGLGYHRYSQLLADLDLSNVTFIASTRDEQVGRLTNQEIAFLTARGAEVIFVDADHETAILEPDSLDAIKRRYGIQQ